MSEIYSDNESEFDNPITTIEKYDRQDRARLANSKLGEKLIKYLKSGKNYFMPADYVALVSYIYPYDQDNEREAAISKGEINLGRGVSAHKVPWLYGRCASLSDLSRISGIPRATLHRHVDRLNLPGQVIGQKKLYNIDMLRKVLELEIE